MISSKVPNTESLTSGLAALLQDRGAGARFQLIDRQANPTSSTFSTEIVTCRLDDGAELRLFCKHSGHQCLEAYRAENHQHRGGVAYEAEVYRQVLQPLALEGCPFYGVQRDARAGQVSLVLGYLDACWRVNQAWKLGSMARAARWIGRFHRANEARVHDLAFLTRYDEAYYRGWVQRTSEFARLRRGEFPWLEALAARFPEAMHLLLTTCPTVVHGEYTPDNVLYRNGEIAPVDWEAAAVGAGEIDAVALTEGCDPETVQECEQEYLRARWPEGQPNNWRSTVSAARLYMNFRWLGQRMEWTVHEKLTWRFEALRRAGEELDLL